MVDFLIPKENMTCKGVVSGWSTVMSFEAIGLPSRIMKLERLMRREYDRERREVKENASESIVITWEGSRLPENLALYNRLVRLKVRAFVPAVIQCFKCYRFGHFKIHCRNKEICKVCGDKFHGRCDRQKKCINCRGQHMATDRSCEAYRYNNGVKKVMVERQVHIREARNIYEKDRINRD